MTKPVFISHASEDAEIALEICDVLEKSGIACWIYERDIAPGATIDRQGMTYGIELCPVMVVIHSVHTAEDEDSFVPDEVAMARNRKKRIVVFRIQDVGLGDALEPYLVRRVWLDGFPPPAREHASKIVESVRPYVTAEPTTDETLPPSSAVLSKLPAQNLDFVGRDDLLAEIDAALGDGRANVAIIGGPGFGKSQVAFEYAHRHIGEYELVCAISAEGRDAAVSNFAALAEDLGLPPQESQDQAVAAVRARFADAERWLLILDNAEHPDDIRDLLPEGNGHVLVTALENRGWRRRIGAQEVTVGPMPTTEATQFLLKRTDRNDEAGATLIAQELEGNALLLEQVAAYIEETHMSFAECLEQLHQDFDATLAEGMPSNYPRTAVATWNLVLAKIVETFPEAGDVFSLTGFLAPDDVPIKDFDLPMSAVNALVRSSLVQRTGEYAFSVHRTVQQMARARLSGDERTIWAEAAVKLCLGAFPDDPSDVLNRAACAQLRPHATAALTLADKLGTDAHDRARLHDRVGVFYRSRAQYAKAREELELALGLLSAAESEADPLAGTVRSHLGGVLGDQGEFADALAHHEAALRIHEAVHESEHRDIGDDRAELGSMFLTRDARHDLAGAREQFELALSIHANTLGTAHRYVAVDHLLLASVFAKSGNVPPAIAHLEQAIGVYDAMGQVDHPEARVARFLLEYFSAAVSGSELGSARERLEGLVSIYEQTHGEDHPEVAEIRQTLADHLFKVGELQDAAANYARAYEIDASVYGARHWKVGRDLMRLFVVLAAEHETDAARERLESALTTFAELADAEDRGVPLNLVWFDDALGSFSAIPAATDELERLVAICQEATGPSSLLVAAALDHLGAELREAGNNDLALKELQRAVELFERHLGPQHVRLAQCLRNVGATQAARGDLESAEREFERAWAIHELAESRNDLDVLSDLLGLLPVRLELDARDAEDDPSAEPRAPRVLERIREVAESAIGIEPLRVLAEGLLAAGVLDEALKMHDEVLQKLEETYGVDHPEVAAALNRLAIVHWRLRDLDAARSCFERALEIHEAQYGPHHAEVASGLVDYLAPLLVDLGEPELALERHARGVAIYDRLLADDTKWFERARTDSWLRLGDLAFQHGRPDEAGILYQGGLDRVQGPVAAGAIHGRLGGLAAAQGDDAQAIDQLRESAALFAEAGRSIPFAAVVDASALPFRDADNRRQLDHVLRQLREELIVNLPTAAFRPRLAAVMPADWFAKESMTLLAPDGQANVIASSEPLDAGIDTKQYADAQGELLRSEFPGYDEKVYEETDLFGGGRRGYLRHFEWTPPDGVPVTQLQLYYAENGRGFTATATTPSSNFSNVESELRQILAGLSI